MGITINNNPVDPKVARFLSAIMKARGKRATRLVSSSVQNLLDISGDKRVDIKDYRLLKNSIKAKWFTPGLFRKCVKYIDAIPSGAAQIEYRGKGTHGRGEFRVKLAHVFPKGVSLNIEVMKSSRLKLVFERSYNDPAHAMPRLDRYKPFYISRKLLEREGFKLRRMRKSSTLPAGVHQLLIALARKALVKSRARSKRSRS